MTIVVPLFEINDYFKWWEVDDWIDLFKEWWEDLVEWFEDLLEAIIDLISELIAYVLEVIEDVVEAVVEAGLALVEVIVAAVIFLLEMLLKALLLALIYLILSLTIFGELLGFGIIVPIITAYVLLNGGYIKIGFLSIEFELKGVPIEMNTRIEWIYSDYFDLNIPIVVKESWTNGELIYRNYFGVLIGDAGIEFAEEPTTSEFNKIELTEDQEDQITLEDENVELSGNPEEQLTWLDGSVDPKNGDTRTTFKFEVEYFDLNNTAPKGVYVAIAGMLYLFCWLYFTHLVSEINPAGYYHPQQPPYSY
ncbi:MAG: hypothetical protein ACTSPD_02165 [Promethearchaeota archaeon]